MTLLCKTYDLDALLETKKTRKMADYIDTDNFHPTHGVSHLDFQCQVCLCLRDQVKKCETCEVFICEPCLN